MDFRQGRRLFVKMGDFGVRNAFAQYAFVNFTVAVGGVNDAGRVLTKDRKRMMALFLGKKGPVIFNARYEKKRMGFVVHRVKNTLLP